jgi:hypothetical protein
MDMALQRQAQPDVDKNIPFGFIEKDRNLKLQDTRKVNDIRHRCQGRDTRTPPGMDHLPRCLDLEIE